MKKYQLLYSVQYLKIIKKTTKLNFMYDWRKQPVGTQLNISQTFELLCNLDSYYLLVLKAKEFLSVVTVAIRIRNNLPDPTMK